MTATPYSNTLTDVIALLCKREKDGRSTHGTTVDRTDYSLLRWLKESQEEKADDLLYMGAAIRVAEAMDALLARAEDLLKQAPPITNDMYIDHAKTISFGKQSRALANEIKTFRGIA